MSQTGRVPAPRRPWRVLAAAVTAAAALTACSSGGGASAAPDRHPTTTTATTTPAPAAASPATTAPAVRSPGVLSAWTACGDAEFSCATLTVALDDTRPQLGTIALALTRKRACRPSGRIGSLLVNPGGPGESAVEFLQAAWRGIPAEVRARFDLVAFDPRGVGRTSPVRCETTAELDDYFHLDPAPTTTAGLAQLDRANAALTAGCQRRSGRLLPYVGTRVVAQDLDRVRSAVGDARLTYLGYSYGTSIGASYLEQFPTHVRAMVLDGALDPTLSWDALSAGQAKGFDVALLAFLADCERIRCAFRQAVGGDLPAAYDALSARVSARPLPGAGRRTVGKAEFEVGVLYGLYSKNLWPSISAALVQALHGQGAALLSLSDAYLQRTGAGYANVSEANYAVNCVDRPWPRTDAPYVALAKQVGRNYPRFGPTIALSGLGCTTWPVPAVNRPHPVRATGAPPVVVVGTTRDPATPYAWAVGLARQLDSGILLTHVGDGHTAYRVGARSCLVDPVNRYLLTTRPPVASTC